MKYIMCDGCSLPIKGLRFVHGIAEFEEDPYNPENLANRVKPIHYVEREVCAACHLTLLNMFEHKADYFLKQSEEFRKLFAKPAKTPLHELKKKRKK